MLIEKHEGSLEEFAQGYLKFGFNKEDNAIVYREWAPPAQEAQLIGDFNEWDGTNHKMEKDQFGMWTIRIPDSGGTPAIPHGSKVKFRFKHGNGVWVDRIPAWIKYATVDPAKFAAPYDGVFWDPKPLDSSRSGTPEDLWYLIDKAHSLGLWVLMDMIHSHASNNVTDGLNGFDVGQGAEESYFHPGERGYHKLWDSRLFNYANWEVLRFLLSNLRWWLEDFIFDGFRFDGVTSMLYHDHGIGRAFRGNYDEYFNAIVIAEDVSGMLGLGRTVSERGIGFDYRLAMAIPDKWIDYLKNMTDDKWSMEEITSCLTNRRYTEKCISYAESHDQSIVGDKTIAFSLMDKEMYFGMSCLSKASPTVERGIALHKVNAFDFCSFEEYLAQGQMY
ncbi:hypothetical protein MKX01_034442 [Papaver californicum]|nr:hypothetical protein MKX01_034442 [Papaver californicum]